MVEIEIDIRFRFHTGSIKSVYGQKLPPIHQSFDSILVRLKVPVTPTTTDAPTMFRFHTGSIKSGVATFGINRVLTFRFHTGSIKSCTFGDSLFVARWVFRFHTGSIKRCSRLYHEQISIGFDSILVRLKDEST